MDVRLSAKFGKVKECAVSEIRENFGKIPYQCALGDPGEMSKPSRLVKPSKQSQKEPPGNRSHMLVVGERLMRAGSEGNLVRSRPPQKPSDTNPVGSNPGIMLPKSDWCILIS